MNNKPLVIYHKGCLDGIAAAWCFYSVFGDSYDYHEGVYGEPIPDVKDRVVHMLDFSYKMEAMVEILKLARVVNVLDHHESAIEELSRIPIEYDNLRMSWCTTKMSGCAIAWNYLNAAPMPAILKHIQDRDLWRFELPNTREICAALYSGNPTYKCLTDLTLARLKLLGSALVKEHDSNVERIIKTCKRDISLSSERGYITVPAVNANHMFSSDIGNELAKISDIGVGCTYYDSEEYRNFSLRSTKEGLNVAKIAALYGGGGHEHAAGFKVTRDNILART